MNAVTKFHLLVNTFASTPLDPFNALAITVSLFNPICARASRQLQTVIVHLTESVEATVLVCASQDGLDYSARYQFAL